MDAAAPPLEARSLVKRLGGRTVVDGVDLRCDRASVLGLLGPNGAGKTTTLRMLYGFLEPDGGSILVDGEDVTRRLHAAKRRIGICTQDDTFDDDFSVAENLRMVARYYRPRPERLELRVATLLERFGLADFARQRPQTLSGGYRRRLMIARALVHGPRILFLDEPTTGLDPQARVQLWSLIDELRADGLAIVLTTHYMEEAERLSDSLLVLAQGRVLARGSSAEVLGATVGEHVLVVDPAAEDAGALREWLAQRGGRRPATVMGIWHVALRRDELGALTQALPGLRFELRKPSLDDLFLSLSGS